MKLIYKNNVAMRVPEDISFAYSKSLVSVECPNLKRVFLHIGYKDKQYDLEGDAFDRVCIIDISAYVRAFFDGLSFSLHEDDEETLTQLGINVSWYVGYELEDGTVEKGFYTGEIFYVWGGLAIGETFGRYAEYVAWEGYPFSVMCMSDGAGGVSVGGQQVDLPSKGIYAFGLDAYMTIRAGETIDVTDRKGTIAKVTFDGTYGYTFSTANYSSGERIARITVRENREGMYLRWIDRHGFYRYWLFEVGSKTRNVASNGEFLRDNLPAYNQLYGYLGLNGRRQSYSREDAVEVCASMVDSDTFDMLQDLTTSPVVDMYMGDYNWQSVTIKEGTYTKVGATLQDFVCSVAFNNIPLQRL